jgi:hypothetical protein
MLSRDTNFYPNIFDSQLIECTVQNPRISKVSCIWRTCLPVHNVRSVWSKADHVYWKSCCIFSSDAVLGSQHKFKNICQFGEYLKWISVLILTKDLLISCTRWLYIFLFFLTNANLGPHKRFNHSLEPSPARVQTIKH